MKKITVVIALFLLFNGLYAEDNCKKQINMLEKRIESLEKKLMAQQIEIYLNRLRIKQADTLTNRNVNVILEKYKIVDKLDTAYRELDRIKSKINKIYVKFRKEKDLKQAEKLFEQAEELYGSHLKYSVVKGF